MNWGSKFTLQIRMIELFNGDQNLGIKIYKVLSRKYWGSKFTLKQDISSWGSKFGDQNLYDASGIKICMTQWGLKFIFLSTNMNDR